MPAPRANRDTPTLRAVYEADQRVAELEAQLEQAKAKRLEAMLAAAAADDPVTPIAEQVRMSRRHVTRVLRQAGYDPHDD
ncbi:hypothetical protein SAMN04487819_11684 [Actinopolyspora alba]|uniref:Homeodomain-like domain-containing protein n=1 Tax=Actinopolyspora alba TaxID=673379 RepID=A0A1I2BFS4_9ACTN|nr:helix-turn-helix domain-containing protein [Actinopolyspora alba]SFE55034.1 hypothetical protein SAMN04487819_11684 [Actinopolyspora alba]